MLRFPRRPNFAPAAGVLAVSWRCVGRLLTKWMTLEKARLWPRRRLGMGLGAASPGERGGFGDGEWFLGSSVGLS